MNEPFSDDDLERALRQGLHDEAAATDVPDRYDQIVYEVAPRRRSRTWASVAAVAAALAVGFGGGILVQPLMTLNGAPIPGAGPTVSATRATGSATAGVSETPVPAGFDRFPAGYDHATLSSLDMVNGRWSVVLDPLTVCMTSLDKPECSGERDPIPNGSAVVNVSTKVFRVPLAGGVAIQVLDGGNSPTVKPYLTLPLAAKTWPIPVEVVISLNANNEVTSIRQFWRK